MFAPDAHRDHLEAIKMPTGVAIDAYRGFVCLTDSPELCRRGALRFACPSAPAAPDEEGDVSLA